jgi:lipid A oxidase
MLVWEQRLRAVSKIRILVLPFAAILLISATERAAAEIELSFYIGPQDGHPSEITGTDPAGVGAFSFDADWEGRSFEAPPHYGFRATWWQTERLGWALDFNHAKVYADDATLAALGFPVLEFTDGLNLLTAGPMMRFPSAERRWTPYIGAGLGIAIPYVEVQTQAGAPATREYQVTGLAATALAGVSCEITDRWSIFGEAKIGHSQIDADLVGGGTLDTSVTTRQLNLGVSYRFR